MYVLRQMVEKRLEVQDSMALGFVDLEKAFDTVPREMVMATLWWMGVPEAEVRMVESSKSDGGRRSFEEFDVKIGLRPLLYRALLDLISRKTVVKDAMKKLLYTDDLALVANGKHGDGKTEREVRRRVQAGANAWRE